MTIVADRTPGAEARPLSYETVVADHAARVSRKPDAFVTTLLRSRSVQGRDILAHLASGGRRTSAALLADAAAGDLSEIAADLDPELAGRLATVVALQGPRPDPEAAVALFAALERHTGLDLLRPRDVAVYLQLLSRLRAGERLAPLLAAVSVDDATAHALAADSLNPFLHPSAGDTGQWLPALARALGFDTPITLGDGPSPFDRLHAAPGGQVSSHARVTVVTSAFNPDAALVNAARSLVAQSWQNWEMLIVDDASTDPGSRRFLAEAEALDPRIRVVRKAVNGGTYRARNTALMLATGDFLTCLDSDDWAHPDRLLDGVVPMLENPGVVATRGMGARVSEQLEVTRPGYRTLFPAASSLMFRVRPVVERVGFFDPVRKGADTEYARRIESAFGRRVLDIGRGAQTVLRGLDDSLSAGEFSFGWRHPVRWAYKQSYGERHRRIRAGEVPAYLEPDAPQPAYGTERWLKPGDPGHRGTRHLDVVLAGDWRRFGGPQISMLEELDAFLAEGLTVGVMHLEAMRFFTGQDQPLCAPLRELLAAGRVSLVHPDDDVDVDLLMVRYPPILQFPPAQAARVRSRRVLIVANQAPAEKDGKDQRYVPVDVHRNTAELFGTEPSWVPQSPAIRAMLEPLLPGGALAAWDDPAIIDVDGWRVDRVREPGARPVVGRFSRDDVIKFPRTGDDLLRAYGFGPGVRVRMMGARTQVRRLLQESGRTEQDVPANWEVLPHKAMDVRDFVSGLDVVVYMDHPEANEAFGRSLLEAAASGVLVVAARKHEITFGDALLYAEPDEVVPLVESYLADPERMRQQIAHTERRVRERWGRDTFLEHVRAELAAARVGDVAPPPPPGPGSVSLRPGAAWTSAPAVSVAGALRCRTVRVRRQADAEVSDHLTVVHDASAEPGAVEEALGSLLAAHRPGHRPTSPEPFPPALLAAVWRVDGEWVPLARDGVDVARSGGGVHVGVRSQVTGRSGERLSP